MIDEHHASRVPVAAPLVAALPLTTPFVAPEELARRAGRDDLLRLGANESSFGPPPNALAAMRESLDYVAWYGDPESYALRVALARKHGCALENISVGSGIDDLLGLVVRAYLAPGDVAVGARGTYPTFVYHVAGHGGRFETIDYAPDGTIDLERLAIKARASADTRLVYLANPDNPSGSFAERAAIAALIDALPARVMLVLDEAYADFVDSRELLAETIDPRILRLRTFSKAYGLAGARIAYALGAPETIANFQKIRNHYGVARTAQAGALVALDERAFVDGVVAEVARGREEYARIAGAAGTRTLPSRTNFVLFDVQTRARAEAVVAALLQRGVFVRKPGAAPLDRFVRVTVGTPSERERFGAAFADAMLSLDEALPTA
jgi:histidinol-phosphate aminotransferase